MKTAKITLSKAGWGFALLLGAFLVFAGSASAEWNFGIGTGYQMMSLEGDVGGGKDGESIEFKDIDLDSDDISDATDGGLGFFVYATDGCWTLRGAYGKRELEWDRNVDGDRYELDFDMTEAEFVVERAVWKCFCASINLFGGVRYMKHEWEGTVDGDSESFDQDWTDAIFGVSSNVRFADNWTWTAQANAGFGGSDGTYQVGTGLNWQFLKHWSAGINAKYTAVDFEDGTQGGSGDWYKYDVDETKYGVQLAFNW